MSRSRNTQDKPNPVGQAQSSIIHAQQTTIYRGQLPPPEMLEKFEAIEPGFTNRLLKMVEQESEFKREHDRGMLASFKTSTVLGIIAAFLSVLVISGVAFYGFYKGFGTAAAYIMTGGMATVVVAFLGRKIAKNDKKGNG